MPFYRKKPVVIEAWLFDGSFESVRHPIGLTSNITWSADGRGGYVSIKTLEGTMRADAGDWIIKGVEGEFYPCKPNIFEATYDALVPSEK